FSLSSGSPPQLHSFPTRRSSDLKFAANLSMMFQELPFLDRFQAAAAAGFRGVEFLFPYDYEADEIAKRLRASDLENVLFNMPPRSEEHTSELQSREKLVCRLLLE